MPPGTVADNGPRTTPTRVLVVDDHRMFAELLCQALDAEPDFACVGYDLTADAGIAAAIRLAPDIVLMDLHLPDRDGISATAELTSRHPAMKVLILTAGASHAEMTRAGAAGASGFLTKDSSLDDVLGALRTAHRPRPPQLPNRSHGTDHPVEGMPSSDPARADDHPRGVHDLGVDL